MANLSTALNYALAGLTASGAQSAVVARNVSSAGDENYTRKTAQLQTLPGGGPAVAGISRSTDRLLLDKLLSSGSDASGKQVNLEALTRMSALTGDPQDDTSIAAGLGKLQQALRSYEQNPASAALGRAAVEAARTVAAKLGSAAAEVNSIRADADQGMAESAERINNLLAQFKVMNDSVVRGQGTPSEVAENLDQRDAILKHLSEEIGIRTVMRPNNDVLIYAEGGAVLFEGNPREVSFAKTDDLSAGASGNPLIVDGVPVTGAGSPMPLSGGRLAAHAAVRDRLAPQLAQQLDQIAGGLIRAFAENDPQPSAEGLFTGTGTVPLAADQNTGLASKIKLNALADPDQGGSFTLLRDGGFGGAAYVRNTGNLPGYQKRIAELADGLDLPQSFGNWGGIGGQTSVKGLSLQSASWVEGARKSAQDASDTAAATHLRAADSLARVSGVSIDQEMAVLLDLEKSYQASSKVLAVVDSMLGTLMDAVGR